MLKSASSGQSVSAHGGTYFGGTLAMGSCRGAEGEATTVKRVTFASLPSLKDARRKRKQQITSQSRVRFASFLFLVHPLTLPTPPSRTNHTFHSTTRPPHGLPPHIPTPSHTHTALCVHVVMSLGFSTPCISQKAQADALQLEIKLQDRDRQLEMKRKSDLAEAGYSSPDYRTRGSRCSSRSLRATSPTKLCC